MATHWITKYALSDGVFTLVDGKVTENGYLTKTESDPWRHHFYTSREFHPTKYQALERANEMRLAKIASLKRQIAKLEVLDIKVKEA